MRIDICKSIGSTKCGGRGNETSAKPGRTSVAWCRSPNVALYKRARTYAIFNSMAGTLCATDQAKSADYYTEERVYQSRALGACGALLGFLGFRHRRSAAQQRKLAEASAVAAFQRNLVPLENVSGDEDSCKGNGVEWRFANVEHQTRPPLGLGTKRRSLSVDAGQDLV